jgi:hypothetical protein
MMNRSRRGAARVNVIWIIVVLIAFFAALAMVFVFDGELKKAENARDAAVEAQATAEDNYDKEREYGRVLSGILGWYDEDTGSKHTEADAADTGLNRFKDDFGVTEPSAKDFQDVIAIAASAYTARGAAINDLTQQKTGLTSAIEVKSAALITMTQEKDARIQELQQELTDANQSSQARLDEKENSLTSVRSNLSDTERQLRVQAGESEAAQRQWRDREAEYNTRLENVTRTLEWQREPERPDGKVLDVSEKLNLAWIDLSKGNRLYAGMRFTIVDGRPGNDTIKARCEVLQVGDVMSEVLFFDQRDPFDPPTSGDIIYNPIYDPVGIRNAVLVGRFSGTYNENEVRALLDGIRINLQDKLDKTTDYLVVGAELYFDEDGEPLEDPMQPSDLPVYKEAEAMGVRIVPIKLINDYFRKSQS